MQNLNIAILSYRSAKFGGGQGVYIKDISFALTLMGHNVDVISGPPYPDLHDGVKLIKLPGLDLFETFSFKDRFKKFKKKKSKNFNDYYEFFTALIGGFPEPRTFGNRVNAYLINNNNYDVIIDNQSISYGLIEIQKRFPLIEIIHHPITFDFKFELAASKKIKYKVSRYLWYSFLKMQKQIAPKLQSIITPSQSSKKGIIEEFNCKKDNITVINNGIDTEEFSPIVGSVRDPNRLITTASADVPLKGLDYSLKALKILRKDNPNIHLIVIGSYKKGGHTERLIKELNIKDNIFFYKNLSKEEIRDLYSTSSVALVTSLYEGFGYPVIEAMSCEVPLVATNVSSIPELVGKYGILIDPKDENQLSNKIRAVLSNYGDHKKIAIQGRQHVINTFNWSKITHEYEKAIFKTIESHKKC
ncbi:MAG: D-inositol 3-phosphate glycosyltransferase [Flavobacterium sp. SCGC AAA160-P02]|nr:MAG: D-inositol 3-phosphate glycosyltransferase [Flavobacterium sp. SCGC AAA160-P02]